MKARYVFLRDRRGKDTKGMEGWLCRVGGAMAALFFGDSSQGHTDPANWGKGLDFVASAGRHDFSLFHLIDHQVSLLVRARPRRLALTSSPLSFLFLFSQIIMKVPSGYFVGFRAKHETHATYAFAKKGTADMEVDVADLRIGASMYIQEAVFSYGSACFGLEG